MSYQEFKTEKIKLENEVDFYSDTLNSFDWMDEKIRMSEEFQNIKKRFNLAQKNLQVFNLASKKDFKIKLSQERRFKK